MNGVESAASLFGPEEPLSDPFATLGANTIPEVSVDDPFHDGAFNPSEFQNTDSHDSNTSGAEGDTTQDTSQFYTQSESTFDSHANSDGSIAQQGWYDEHGQWRNSENPAERNSITTKTGDYANSDNIYDPYAPSSNTYATPTNAQIYPQTTYNQHIPPQPPKNYSPQFVAPTTSTHSPYSYTPSSVYQDTTSQPTYSGGVQRYPVQRPPPDTLPSSAPSPAATVTRPKLPNAYDPPFPTTKSTRRGGRTGVSQPSHGYSAYEPLSPVMGPFAVPPPSQSVLHPTYGYPTIHSSHSMPLSPTQSSVQTLQGSSPVYNGNANNNNTASFHNDASYYGNGVSYNHGPPIKNEAPNATPRAGISVEPNPIPAKKPPFNDSHSAQSYGAREPYQEHLPRDPSVDQFPSATPSNEEPHLPKTSPPQIPTTSLLPRSPYQTALPPSPTIDQWDRSNHHSTLNPIDDQQIVSPNSFVEPKGGRLRGADLYEPLGGNDNGVATRARSPQISASDPTSTSVHVHGARSSTAGLSNPYLPRAVVGDEKAFVPTAPLNGQAHPTTSAYAPKTYVNGHKGERVGSPGPFSIISPPGVPESKHYSVAQPYTPAQTTLHRDRSMSNSSLLSSTSISAEDHYMPPRYPKRSLSEAKSNYYPASIPESGGQEVSLGPFQTVYAPSPSLIGANDPLGRSTARVPVFSFGFGGKFVTCFHGADTLNTGFDVALSSRNSTGIHIRALKALIPDSALDTSTASFPGPLFSDPGTLTTSLVRAGTSTQTKTKKIQVIKYLSERTDELAMGLRYLRPDSVEGQRAEGKLVLVKMLRLMVEYDGRLTGTPELDTAVRIALVPRLENNLNANGPADSFTTIADGQHSTSLSVPAVSGFTPEHSESAISVTTLRPSALDKIQEFLLRGERKKAYHYALDEKLWAHAMIISSSIDKEAWQEVVNEFLKNELGSRESTTIHPSVAPINGRESLRVAYSLFSGQGSAAVQELMPPSLLARTTGRPQPQVMPHLTPRTPNFTTPTQPQNISIETLSKWTETVTMMLSTPLSQETSSALTGLGDQLAANQLFEAAHVCYLLAPQTSPLGGLGNPSARIVLVGSGNPKNWPSFSKDPDPVIFSEVVEFALSLPPSLKGQDTYTGIPHLQAYRFIRAMALAEVGDIQLANKYCDAITTAANRSSPYITPILLEQLKGLSDRIAGVTQVDKSFWTGAKISKPSLDTIGGWLEGRFTKLVTGDTETEETQDYGVAKPDERGFSGPFSHYSTISSATPSARSSPQPSIMNHPISPPTRSGSAMASSSPYIYHQIDRASSAMDYVKRKPSPGPRITSANVSATTFSSLPSPSQVSNNQHSRDEYSPSGDLTTPKPSLNSDDNVSQEATWWGSSMYEESNAIHTPTGSTFLQVNENDVVESSDGFISLMDNTSYSITPQTAIKNTSQIPHYNDEDLGLGNSKRDQPSEDEGKGQRSPSPPPAQTVQPPQPETKPISMTGGSWISRWWRKSESTTPGPVKANLGEESTFYYDKDLKRWVNKKSGTAETTKATTAPPPSRTPPRAQTASPGMTGPRPSSSVTESGSPPARSASAIDLSTSPPSRTVMRVRSNLVPTPDSAPSTPTGTRLAPPGPPPGRPKSQASKRNIRNRYVDVFQQDGAA